MKINAFNNFLNLPILCLKVANYFKTSALILIFFSLVLLIAEMFIPGIFTWVTDIRYNGRNLVHVLFYNACTFIFLLFLPLLLNRFFYHEDIKELGLSLPKNYLTSGCWTVLALALTIPFILYVTNLKAFQLYYSLQNSNAKLIFAILFILPTYYFCEEFFFRGFLFLNLWKRIGWHSFWITDILFTLAHIGKPFVEIIIALPVGIVLAALTLRTRSIYPSMFVHYVLGTTMLLRVNNIV